MADTLALSQSGDILASLVLIPKEKKYMQNYRVSRIKLEPIDITEEMANDVFEKILSGDHAIVLGKHLVMCSSISSIDPLPLDRPPVEYKPMTLPEQSEAEYTKARQKIAEIRNKILTK